MQNKKMKLVNIVLFLLIFQGHIFAQQSVNGRIVNGKTGKGISFVTVVAIDQKNLGAISDENGYFKIPLSNDLDSVNFYVSASSYHSRNVFLKSSETSLMIALDEKEIELDEIVVRPLKEGEINWFEELDNLKLYGADGEDGEFVPMMMGLETTGEFHGNAFKLKEKVMLKEIGFHFFLGEGYPDKLYLRIFNTDKKPEFSNNESLEDLTELTKKTILLDNLKDGFNSVDISEANIIANPGYLMIAITSDINGVTNKKLTIYQQKSGGDDVLRFALYPQHFNVFSSFLPKYLLGFRYVELEENKGIFWWFKNIFN